MTDKQIEIELNEEEDDERKMLETEKEERKNPKRKLKLGRRAMKTRKNIENKNVEKENKKKEKQKIQSKNKQMIETEKKEKYIKIDSKLLEKKRKRTVNLKEKGKGKRKGKRSGKAKKDNSIEKEEKNFEKMLQKRKTDFEIDDTESDSNLIIINPISNYVNKKREEWEKNKSSVDFSMEGFSKSISIISEFNYEFLQTLIKNSLDEFYNYYKFYQFTLTAIQRKQFQKIIKDKCDLPIIKNNFIPDSITDIKEILVKLCNSLIKIDCYKTDSLEKLKQTFIDNSVYSEDKFNSSIPVKYGSRELKINKLIFEIVDFFYAKFSMNALIDDKNEVELISQKIETFKSFKPIFEKMELYANDEELIKVFNYLFNSIYVLFNSEKNKRNYTIFNEIITCCMPFELEKAKKFLSELKENIFEGSVYIENIDITEFDIENIKADSKIQFKEKNINVFCKDINCYLTPTDFKDYLEGDKFMFCFRFPKMAEINYLYINNEIRNNYKELFKTIMKSKTMRQAMNIDKEAKLFKYPFDDDLILNEVEKECYLVPLPAKNYFGISDRAYYSIYLNSYIDTSSGFQQIFIDIDSIIKSKCHELKHIYRIYMNIYNPKIELKTPEIHYKSLKHNDLIKNIYSFFQTKEEIISKIYSSKSVPANEVDELDYGDLLEFAINGKKQNVFFISNSLFCLSEKSWKLTKGDFMVKYFKTCFEKSFQFQKVKNNNFINSIIKFFGMETGLKIANSTDINKSSAKKVSNDSNTIYIGGKIENTYYYRPKASHCKK